MFALTILTLYPKYILFIDVELQLFWLFIFVFNHLHALCICWFLCAREKGYLFCDA